MDSSIVAVGAMKSDNDASLLSRLLSHSYAEIDNE
jgi:hypothetical protein